MDTTDKDISFDERGVCSHCLIFVQTKKEWNLDWHIKNRTLEKLFAQIKKDGEGKPYDCLIGLSGGVDSSYIAYLAFKHGLRPLCVHLDNGWNSELAVANITEIVKKFKFELYTHVIDWEEFRDLQISFFKAHVVDIELLSDHAIFGVIVQLAKKFKIKNILSGNNIATESIMPGSWVHRKQDLTNIKAIHKKFGRIPIKSFPQMGTIEHLISKKVSGYKSHRPLNYIDYNKAAVKNFLIKEIGWRDYGGKHYESIFTKFYQGYILPRKFKIDKRKPHLASLVNSEQISREEALGELKRPLYHNHDLQMDYDFVCKKLGFSRDEMETYLNAPAVSHYAYASDEWVIRAIGLIKKLNIFQN